LQDAYEYGLGVAGNAVAVPSNQESSSAYVPGG